MSAVKAELRFFRSELRLIFGRRRNWIALAVLAAVPVVIAFAVKASPPRGRGGPDFISSITENGLFVALAALAIELPLFLPLAVATISGDAIAGEASQGTLRYLLAVPVRRTRLLVVKFLGVVVFSCAATLLVAAVGVVTGVILFGGGEATLLSGVQVPMSEGMLRLLGVCGYLAACLCAAGAIGLFISTLTEQPIGAAIATTIVVMGSFILDSIPELEAVHPYLLTHLWLNFGELLRDPVGWDGLRTGLLQAGAYIVVFCAAAWARFGAKDVTS